MKQKPIPWTLVYTDAPKGLDSLFGTVRVYLSPDQETIEIQTNSKGINSNWEFGWRAWITRVEYDPKKGWQLKQDRYARFAENVYRELFDIPEGTDLSDKDIGYTLTTYAIT
ncbi:hypothetical protein F4Z99_11235, partial [Candidatus Poribacteria bacterium]|nr:hypothetical protein [Candidatus Poribacteria bacterium]